MRNTMKRIAWPILATLTLTAGLPARATEYGVKGSDTLYDVMTDAISAYKTELGLSNPATQDFIKYLGTGSGNGEKSMALHTTANKPYQRIAPMSRNLTSSAQTTCETAAVASRDVIGGVGAGLCRAELKNVLGLDAAVVVESRGQFTSCGNLGLGTDPVDPTIAADANLLQLILGGVGGTGDWAACSSPQRVQAIQTLLNCNVGLGAFTHYYRRDDSSGTSDTVREKLKIQRFCNGEGKPTAFSLNANLGNPDNDPIRGLDCPAAVAGSRKPVRCTVTDPTNTTSYLKDCSSKRCTGTGTVNGLAVPANFAACTTDADCTTILGATGGTCTAGLAPTEPGCTAGFVVSLSEADNTTVTDITMTIAGRVLADNGAIGYAGRESVRKPPVSGQPAFGPTVNTNQPSDGNVRQDKYLMSRRLWVQDTCNQNDADIVTCASGATGPNCDSTTDTTGAYGNRDAAECRFFHWATDTLPSVSANDGRTNLDPIMRKWGFIPCTDNFGQPTGDLNLCSKAFGTSGFPAGNGAPNKCIVNTASTTGWLATTCTGSDPCCSDGKACNDPSHGTTTFQCPAPAPRAAGAACRFNSECASSNCDGFGTATTGTCL